MGSPLYLCGRVISPQPFSAAAQHLPTLTSCTGPGDKDILPFGSQCPVLDGQAEGTTTAPAAAQCALEGHLTSVGLSRYLLSGVATSAPQGTFKGSKHSIYQVSDMKQGLSRCSAKDKSNSCHRRSLADGKDSKVF